MSNRIGRYFGNLADVQRAQSTIGFCNAIVRSHGPQDPFPSWEIDTLHRLEGEAARVLREFGLPLPWESAPNY